MSAGEKRKATAPPEDERVKKLIKQYMDKSLTPNEVKDVLYKQEMIEPSVTENAWAELEKENKEVFEKYYQLLAMLQNQSKDLYTVASLPESSGSNIPPINLDHGWLYVLEVKNMIEQCILNYMNLEQVMETLYQRENIEPSFTKNIWQHLEQQNQQFFLNYTLSLSVNNRIIEIQQQANPNTVPISSLPTEPPSLLKLDRHRRGNLGLGLEVSLKWIRDSQLPGPSSG